MGVQSETNSYPAAPIDDLCIVFWVSVVITTQITERHRKAIYYSIIIIIIIIIVIIFEGKTSVAAMTMDSGSKTSAQPIVILLLAHH